MGWRDGLRGGGGAGKDRYIRIRAGINVGGSAYTNSKAESFQGVRLS